MGKSALLAYWLKNIIEDDRWNVVAHFSANSSQNLDTTDIAKHITTQIDSLYGLEHPIVAIGGITIADIPAVMQTGVSGIALSGTVLHADSPADEMKRIISLMENEK